jgi:acyl-coenzyme A thioesterase PaaI-like protein
MGKELVSVDEVNAFLERDFQGGNGNRCEALGPGWAVSLLLPGAGNLRPGGIISGPTVFGVCDAALYYACFTVIGLEPMT